MTSVIPPTWLDAPGRPARPGPAGHAGERWPPCASGPATLGPTGGDRPRLSTFLTGAAVARSTSLFQTAAAAGQWCPSGTPRRRRIHCGGTSRRRRADKSPCLPLLLMSAAGSRCSAAGSASPRSPSPGRVSIEWLLNGQRPRAGGDPKLEAAVVALRTLSREPTRRRVVVAVLDSLSRR